MLRLIEFLKRESDRSYKTILVIATISGLANTLLVSIVNHATQVVVNGESLTQSLLLYAVAFTLFLQTQWYAFSRAIELIEQALYSKRTRMTQKVRQLELGYIETVGSNRLYARLTQNDTLISQAVPQLVSAFQMLTLTVFSLIYLAYLSPLTFVVTMLALALGVWLFVSRTQVVNAALERVRRKEDGYFRSIAELIAGFKEIKINREKADDLVGRIISASGEAQAIKIDVRNQESRMWGFGRLFIYLLLPIALFVLPGFSHEPAHHLFKISALLLFLMGPITILTAMAPMLARVQLALDDLLQLERDMDAAIARLPKAGSAHPELRDFREIAVEDLVFTFPGGGDAFSVGPFDQVIRRGELLFIIGGNGSGKSTFLKLLTRLYYPQRGRLRVDDTTIDDDSCLAYRSLFSVIFTDFHLFDQFYGIADVDPRQVDYWLERMELTGKVAYDNGGFTTRDLSTGQRKRLAFIVAMLEAKPILVIDEFAADQDPHFRRYFYETILRQLKEQGVTVIAVTHDDHYFHVADRVLKMDEGRFVESGH